MDRLDLQMLLERLLTTTNVYFQPPETVKMKYPCIVYTLSSADTRFADNNPYTIKKRYTVTVIDYNPDSKIPDKVSSLPMCLFERFYTQNNLNHWVYNIYI